MKIADNIYRLEASKGSYVYLILGEEAMLIDTGLSFRGKGIMKELASLVGDPRQIRHILITHHDIDHIGNLYDLQQWTGAKVWASEEDIPYINGQLDRSSFKKYLKYVFKVKIPGNISSYIPGETINGVEIIPTPGHTPGHVSLYYQGVLFAGDLLESRGGKLRPYPKAWNWNNETLLESVKTAESLGAQCICPAHGSPVKGSRL